MSYGTNLSAILGMLKIRYKEAADKIGISYNTLSNIQNNKVLPSEDTKNKILNFLSPYGFSEADLMKEDKIFQNIRIRSAKELSGLEKAQFREDFRKFLSILEESDGNKISWIKDYFNYLDRPTDYTEQETLYKRREILKNLILEDSSKNLFSIIFKYYKEISKGFVILDCYSPVNITLLVDSLGIRVFFLPFRTEKISSFSTSFFTEYTTPNSDFEEDPVIVINTNVCNTTEKCLFQIAKEFFFMISASSESNEYSFMNERNILVENSQLDKKACSFAENIMIGKNELEKFLKKNRTFFPAISPIDKKYSAFFFKNYDFSYVINEIKRVFRISYKLAIKKLFETDFEYLVYFENTEQAENFYFQCLKQHDKEYQDKITYLNGEPEPLPSSFKGHDASMLPTPIHQDNSNCLSR